MVFIIKNKTTVYTKPNYGLKSVKSLQYTGTTKEDWKLADLKAKSKQELNQKGISFTGYSHLQESTPFTDSLIEPLHNFKKQNGCVKSTAKVDATGNIIPGTNELPEWAESNCEFCGKEINKPHIIICDRKKIFLSIDSECRKQFTDAEDPIEQIHKNIILTLRKLLVEKGWQFKMINQIRNRRDYCKTAQQHGKFNPEKLYADMKNLLSELTTMEISTQNNTFAITPLDLKDCSDEKIINIWKLARKAFTLRDPNFLNDISDYINGQKWDV